MEEEGRVQEKGKGSGGSQRKQTLGKERGGRGGGGGGGGKEGGRGLPIPPLPLFLKKLSYIHTKNK